MDILYVLVPLSVVLVFAIVGVLAWSVWNGQFEGIEREGERILHDDDVTGARRAGMDAEGPDARARGADGRCGPRGARRRAERERSNSTTVAEP